MALAERWRSSAAHGRSAECTSNFKLPLRVPLPPCHPRQPSTSGVAVSVSKGDPRDPATFSCRAMLRLGGGRLARDALRLTSRSVAAAALHVGSARTSSLTGTRGSWTPCQRVISSAGRKLSSAARECGGDGEEALCEMAGALADSPELAKVLVARMDVAALREITRAWATLQAEPAPPPQAWQLRRLALLAGLPMVGFGFMVSLHAG